MYISKQMRIQQKPENLKTENQMLQKPKTEMQLVQQKKQQQFQLKKSTYKIDSPPKKLTCIQLYEDTLYLGTRLSKLYIYKIENDKLINQKVLIPHCEIVSSVAACQEFFVTVAESDDEAPMSVWDSKSKMFLTALKSHQSQVSRAIFLSQPGWLATSSWDCTVKIWDLRNILQWEDKVKTIKSEYPVLTVEQIKDDIIAFGGDDCYINIWNWKSMQFLGKYFGHAGSVTLIFSDPNFIITAGGDHKLKQWQFNTMHNINTLSMISLQNQPDKKSTQQKQMVTVTKQIKKSYDSSIFLIRISSNQIFLLDRHGNRFLHRFGQDFITCPNNFKYNENITGMINYAGKIFVVTTKGELLAFQIQRKKSQVEVVPQ